jgi:nitrile hydratase accessory protein
MSGVTPAATRLVMNAVRGIPRDRDGPVFREPWEAQAFAMAVTLQARGLFTWSEWAAALGEEIKRAQTPVIRHRRDYYRHWLATLERMVEQKGVTDPATLARYRDAWDHAAERTPHGTPIELQVEDFAD